MLSKELTWICGWVSVPVSPCTVKQGLHMWISCHSKETIWCKLAVEGRVYYMRRCSTRFHMLMWRMSAQKEQKPLSRFILEHNLKQKDDNRQIAPTSQGEWGFTLRICPKEPSSRHPALMDPSDQPAIAAKRAACLCLLHFLFCHDWIHAHYPPILKHSLLFLALLPWPVVKRNLKNIYLKVFTWIYSILIMHSGF